ncbi:hypothetical protein BSKO_10879 [Bryopsis sp. KO-2023]|nr:hypothetical protein BSKO_10879 [Bryopsis sp. KO-2023]
MAASWVGDSPTAPCSLEGAVGSTPILVALILSRKESSTSTKVVDPEEGKQGPEAVSLLSLDNEGCLVNVPKAPDQGQEAPPAQDEAGPSQENPRPSLPENQSRQPSVEERVEAILKPLRESGDALYFEKRYAEADNKYEEGLRQLGPSSPIILKKDMICWRAAVAMQLRKYVDVVGTFQDPFWNAYDSHRWLLMQALWQSCEGDDGMKAIIKHVEAI